MVEPPKLNRESWETVKIDSGVHIYALNPGQAKLAVDKKKLIIHVIKILAITTIFNYLNSLFGLGIGTFWLGFVVAFLNFKQMASIISLKSRFT